MKSLAFQAPITLGEVWLDTCLGASTQVLPGPDFSPADLGV